MRLAAAQRGRRPVIGLTALIDVVFILLLFFMLATNLHSARFHTLQLAGSESRRAGADTAEVLDIEVPTTGPLRIAGQPVALAALAAYLRRPPGTDHAVRVMPVAGVTVQRLLLVMDALAAAGVARISLDEAALAIGGQPRPAP